MNKDFNWLLPGIWVSLLLIIMSLGIYFGITINELREINDNLSTISQQQDLKPTLSHIRRYDMKAYGNFATMDCTPEGKYVLYDDIKHLIK